MQIFRVTVNGKAYEVTVDDITQTKGVAGVEPQEAAAAEKGVGTAAPAASSQSDVAVSVGADETPVNAPLSGSILAVKVKPGETVKYGQVLLTLEALKMENEIVAPEAGTVKAIFVKEGARVNLGDVLLTLG